MMVWPSGAKNDPPTSPRWKLNWKKEGGGRYPAFFPERYARGPAIAAAISAPTAAAARASSQGLGLLAAGHPTVNASGPEPPESAARSNARSWAERQRSSGSFSRQG